MSDTFDAVISGIASTLSARLDWYEQTGVSHLPHPKKVNLHNHEQAEVIEASIPKSEVTAHDRLQVLREITLRNCERCDLHRTRQNIVFGLGNPQADLMFIGEGPGAEEDRRGEPFVGKAGALLDKMIIAMGYTRESVYICNVVKCRPPNNRDPELEEVQACQPFLKEQIEIVAPKVIVTLGRYASQTLLQTQMRMGEMRGQWQTYDGVTVMPTFHPAYLLRSPERKRDVWNDLQKVMKKLKGH